MSLWKEKVPGSGKVKERDTVGEFLDLHKARLAGFSAGL